MIYFEPIKGLYVAIGSAFEGLVMILLISVIADQMSTFYRRFLNKLEELELQNAIGVPLNDCNHFIDYSVINRLYSMRDEFHCI